MSRRELILGAGAAALTTRQAGAFAPRGILMSFDQLPATYALFGLKRLRKGYAGNCINVRRSSDATTQDFGFIKANGVTNEVGDLLDVASIKTFCGSSQSIVMKWYDQSGNGHDAIQSPSFPGNAPNIDLSGPDPIIFGGNSILTNAVGLTLSSAADYGNNATSLAMTSVGNCIQNGVAQTLAWAQLGTGDGRFALQVTPGSPDYYNTYIKPVTSGSVGQPNPGVAAYQSEWKSLIAEADIAGNVSAISIDGVRTTSTAGGVASTAAVTSTNAPQIFNSGLIDAGIPQFYGSLSHVAFWRNTVFSAADRSNLTSVLNGLKPNRDIGWVLPLGDSLSAPNTGYIGSLQTAFPTWRLLGGGGAYPGQNAAFVLSQFLPMTYQPSYIIPIWATVHDFVTQDSCIASINSMIAHMQQNGFKNPRYLLLGGINQNRPDGSQWIGGSNTSAPGGYAQMKALDARVQAINPAVFIPILDILIANADAGALDQLDVTHGQYPSSCRPSNPITLNGNIGTSDQVIPFTTTPGAAGDVILIDSEYILIITYGTNQIITCTRGYAGTTAASHTSGTVGTDIGNLHFSLKGANVVAAAIAAKIAALGW